MNIKELPTEIQEKIKKLEYNTEKPKKDITGNVYNRLTVLGRGKDYISPGGHKNSQWWCICDCPEHNIILVRISNLTSGNTKSCGCLDKEKARERIITIGHSMALDISNQRFGELIALEPTQERKNNSVIWKCKCSCGRIHYVSLHDLNNHRVESCGHSYDSRGVRQIKRLLNDNNIPYETEKCFPTCKFPDTNGSGRFDFYIDNKFLLEYDGEQHFKESTKKYFRDTLEDRQKRDIYKNQWCRENNIPLKRIPYMPTDSITLEMIMGDDYLVKW